MKISEIASLPKTEFNLISSLSFLDLNNKKLLVTKIAFVVKKLIRYGTKSQIHQYIYFILSTYISEFSGIFERNEISNVPNLFSVNKKSSVLISICQISDLYEILILSYLGISVNFNIDEIYTLILKINDANKQLIEEISEKLALLRENPSPSVIFSILETVDRFSNFHLTDSIKCLVEYLFIMYNSDVNSIINYDYIIDSFDLSCDNYFFELIDSISEKQSNILLFNCPIFYHNNAFELFYSLFVKNKIFDLSIKQESIDNKLVHELQSSINNLGNEIINLDNDILKNIFSLHCDIIRKILKKKNTE